MARIDTLANCFTDICDAVRTVTGTTDKIKVSNIDTEIKKLSTGSGSGETPEIGFVVNKWDEEGYPITITLYGYTSLPTGMFYNEPPNTYVIGNIMNAKLTTVVLPDSVTELNNFVFYKSPALTNINLPDSITIIGAQCFNSCTKLVLNKLPSNLTEIGAHCFTGCTNLTLSSLPESLKKLGTNAFQNCTNITLTSLPETLTEIPAHAFDGCTKLALTELPETLSTVGSYAFDGCTKLALTELPESVTTWGGYAFRNTGISIKTLPSVFGSSIKSIPTYFLAGCTNITEFTFPDITPGYSYYFQISTNAFDGCTNLTMSEFPRGVYTLQNYAFRNCTSLDVPEIEVFNWNANSANWNGNYAFSNTGLTKVKLLGGSNQPSSSGPTYGTYMFSDCLKLEEVEVQGRFVISNYMFKGCTALKKFTLGYRSESQTSRVSIAANSFNGCTSLMQVIITYDDAIATLGATSAFTGTPIADGMGYIYVPDDLVDTYKAASNWSTYADQIKPMSELPTEEVEA